MACPIACRCPLTVLRSTVSSLLRLRHGRNQPLDVLWARQAMVATLNGPQHKVVPAEAGGQLDRVLPGHVGILHPLQNPYCTAGFDHAVEQEVLASVLDQGASDRIRLFGILRWPRPDAGLLDLALDLRREPLP